MSSPTPPPPSADRLKEIADALGISVDLFFEGRTSPFVDGALHLVRLYAGIADLQGRQRVLNIARREAERSEEAPPGTTDPGHPPD